jgi:uncharacterized protein (DUF1778 family)
MNPNSARQATRAPRDQRFNMRMSAQQRQIIATAAAALDKSETDFMLDVTIQEAERVLADRRWFVVDAKAWSTFDRMLDEPVPYENDLRDLLRTPTVFDAQ